MPGQPRSALAPQPRIRLDQLLREAVQPGEDDPLKRSVDDILHGLEELHEKREIYDEADDYFNGDVGMVWASERVQAILDRMGTIEAIRDFNYAAIPVKRIAARLQISSVVPGPAEENEGDEQAQETAAVTEATKKIAALRKHNQLDAEEKRLHMLACKYGEAYLLVWPGVDAEGEDTVDMRVNSPHNVIMIYDEEDSLRPKYALKSWQVREDGKPATRANLYYPDRVERWTTEPGGNAEKRESWFKLEAADLSDLDEEEVEELAADEFYDPDAEDGEDVGGDVAMLRNDIPNPWGRVPFFHFRNDRPPYPEHRDAYGPQQLINKLVYGLAGTIDYAAFPQRYVLMNPNLDDPMQNLTDPHHPDAEDDDPENEGGNSGLDASPGAVWKLWGNSVGQFTPASLDGFLSSLQQIVQNMADLCGLPQFVFTTSGQIPSGESFREAASDFNATIHDRQDRYDPEWQDGYELALKMLGITGVTVDVRWKPVQQVNDGAGWSVIQQKIAAGVPPKVALEEAGYPAEQVDEWLKDATGADLGRRVALLNQVATATQALGASIVTGAVSAEQVQALIAALFGDLMAGTDFKLPAGGDYVDPQAALKAQQSMQDKQLAVQQQAQQAQLEHATQTQTTAQDHQAAMAEAAHQRMQESLRAGGALPPGRTNANQPASSNQPANGTRPGRRPGGRR